jgi:hypothetical protein
LRALREKQKLGKQKVEIKMQRDETGKLELER